MEPCATQPRAHSPVHTAMYTANIGQFLFIPQQRRVNSKFPHQPKVIFKNSVKYWDTFAGLVMPVILVLGKGSKRADCSRPARPAQKTETKTLSERKRSFAIGLIIAINFNLSALMILKLRRNWFLWFLKWYPLIFVIYLFLITFLPNVFRNVFFFSIKTNQSFYLAIIPNSRDTAYCKANSLCAQVNKEHLDCQEGKRPGTNSGCEMEPKCTWIWAFWADNKNHLT